MSSTSGTQTFRNAGDRLAKRSVTDHEHAVADAEDPRACTLVLTVSFEDPDYELDQFLGSRMMMRGVTQRQPAGLNTARPAGSFTAAFTRREST